MRIRDILRQKGGGVVTIEPGRTVQEAILRLNERGIGSLVVTGAGGQVVGIMTERDVLVQCGERCIRDPEQCKCPATVGDVMTTDLVTGSPDDEIGYVMAMMTKHRVRHLPVIEEGQLAGIVSIGDVVYSHLKSTEFQNQMLMDYIHGVTAGPGEAAGSQPT
jgi:CBS domain-containing protein